jgi:murein DD-endopeptidase MepM/ murein hydrolase activator NlpD
LPVAAKTDQLPLVRGRIPTVGILSYLFPRTETHKHQGLDFPAPIGTPVRSVTKGYVTDSGNELTKNFSGYGRFVQVQFTDPPLRSVFVLYAHLDKALVKPGETISKGQQIGTVGNTCFNRSDPYKACKGAHLHFEVRTKRFLPSEGGRLDPVVFLAQHGQIKPQILVALKKEEKESKQKASLGFGMVVLAAIAGIIWYKVKS